MIGLDGSFIIDFLQGKKEALKKGQELNVPLLVTPINIFEIFFGIFRSKRNIEEQQAIAKEFFARCDLVDISSNSAINAAKIAADLQSKGKPMQVTDVLICSTYLSNGCNRRLCPKCR